MSGARDGRPCSGGQCATGNVGDADLVCSLGTGILMRAAEYERARDLARSWLALLGAREHDIFYVYCVVREAIADLLCGNVDAALQSIRENLALGPQTERWVRFVILQDLYSMTGTTGDRAADARVVAFAAEVLANLEEGRPLAPRALAAKTNAELARVIRRSFRSGRRRRS